MKEGIKIVMVACLACIMPTMCFAGVVRGKVTEQGTEEPMTGATIATQNGQGVTVDVDGNYSLTLQKGTYTLMVRFIGYKPIIKKDVRVSKEDMVLDFMLEPVCWDSR